MHVDADHENPLPNRMPAFGLAAVPSPTKNRKTAPGYQPSTGAVDEDPTEAINDTTGSTGSPVDTCADGTTGRDRAPNSRRLAAATVHANGPAPEPSPEPKASHANTSSLTPATPPASAAGAGALITGTDAAGGNATSTTDTPAEPPSTPSGESTSGATASTASTAEPDETDGDRSTESEFTSAASLTPDTTEPGRG